jgi:hypothetical protein
MSNYYLIMGGMDHTVIPVCHIKFLSPGFFSVIARSPVFDPAFDKLRPGEALVEPERPSSFKLNP